MEPNQIQNLVSQSIDKIGKQRIGRNKYMNLLTIPVELRTEEQNRLIQEFEETDPSKQTPEQVEFQKNYFEKLRKSSSQGQVIFDAKALFVCFRQWYRHLEGREFELTEDSTENIKLLLFYFTKDQRFFDCKNLHRLSEPNFDKGLLIVGNFGNGKTSTMRVFEHIFSQMPGYEKSFRGYAANDLVEMYETCNDNDAKNEFWFKVTRGNRYFDDIKTERQASNYGKVNIFKDVFEKRYNRMKQLQINNEGQKRYTTHITCNYRKDFEGDVNQAIQEFGEIYGGRVYDRIFEMFNIIEFKGKSFRK